MTAKRNKPNNSDRPLREPVARAPHRERPATLLVDRKDTMAMLGNQHRHAESDSKRPASCICAGCSPSPNAKAFYDAEEVKAAAAGVQEPEGGGQ